MCTRSTIYIAPATIYEERSVAPVNKVEKSNFCRLLQRTCCLPVLCNIDEENSHTSGVDLSERQELKGRTERRADKQDCGNILSRTSRCPDGDEETQK